MVMLAELRAAGLAALQLPRALRVRGCAAVHQVGADSRHLPVLLVHGYAGSEAVWAPVRRALADAGFGHLVSLSYNSLSADLGAVADELIRQGERALEATGAPAVHLIGHSLGGLIVRYAAQSDTLLHRTAAAVTVATPHRGAWLARIAPGPCARIMHPRSELREALAAPAGGARWLSLYSDSDRIVPSSSARLTDPRFRATNVHIPGTGHLTICRDPRLVACLVGELIRTEHTLNQARLNRAGRAQHGPHFTSRAALAA
jgi:pimeloyl-ACP methyl ester carboxylesterase